MSRSFTDQTENDVLNWLFGSSTYALRLSTSIPAGETITEPSGGYLEQPIVFGAASGGVISNTNALVFGPATLSWGKIVAWAVRDTALGLTRVTGYMGTPYLPPVSANSNCIYTLNPSTNTVQWGSSLSTPADGSRVFIVGRDPDEARTGFPATFGISRIEDGVEYFVVESGVGGAAFFKLSLTLGGAPIDILDPVSSVTFQYHAGEFTLWTSTTQTVGIGDQLVIPIGGISISLK